MSATRGEGSRVDQVAKVVDRGPTATVDLDAPVEPDVRQRTGGPAPGPQDSLVEELKRQGAATPGRLEVRVVVETDAVVDQWAGEMVAELRRALPDWSVKEWHVELS